MDVPSSLPAAGAATAIVLLAAGRGSRFSGGHKLMAPFGASTVLCTTIGNALASLLPVVVVTTRAFAETACDCVAKRDVVIVDDAVQRNSASASAQAGTASDPYGMGHSIAVGVAACAHARGWLVLPADMPLVQASTLQAVAHALEQHPVAYAQHRGRRGHPVGFSPELFSELVALQGDVGARRLVASYPAHGVETPDAGVLVDIDTRDDLTRAADMLAGNVTAVSGWL